MKKDRYFNVVKLEGESAAELLLYGYIGQQKFWENDPIEDLTDLAVVKALNELEKEYSRINIRINSPGGSVYHGDAIISAIQRSPAEIHCYNDGMAASMAAQIWFASSRRHMAKNAKLMIHPTLAGVIGNAKVLREEADNLDKYDEALVSMISNSTDMSEEEVRQRYIAEYRDNFLTYRDAMEAGFVTEEEEYEAQNVIRNVENMTYIQLLEHFNAKPENNEKASFLKELKDTIVGTFRQMAAPDRHTISSPNNSEMTQNELKKSIESGDIKLDEVAAVLRENNYTVEPVQDQKEEPETVDLSGIVTNAITAAIKPLQEKLNAVEAELEKVGGQAGGARTNADAPEDPEDGMTPEQKEAKKALDAMNQKFAAAGKNRERISFS